MTKLITLLVAGIPALMGAILGQWGRKWVTLSASLAAWTAITIAFIASVNVCVGELAQYFNGLPTGFANAIGMFVPADFGAVIGCIVSCHIARAAYDFASGKVKMFNTAT